MGLPLGSGYREAARLAGELATRVRSLQAQSIDPLPAWLAPEYAMSIFGLSGPEIWRQALVEMLSLTDEVERRSADLGVRVTELAESPAPAVVRQAILAAGQRLLDQRDQTWNQDGGYQGVLALLHAAITMCEQALAGWAVELGPPAGPYGHLDTNPYHLVAGSYLAAIGVVGGAVQLLRVTEAELAMAEKLAQDQTQAQPARLLATGR